MVEIPYGKNESDTARHRRQIRAYVEAIWDAYGRKGKCPWTRKIELMGQEALNRHLDAEYADIVMIMELDEHKRRIGLGVR